MYNVHTLRSSEESKKVTKFFGNVPNPMLNLLISYLHILGPFYIDRKNTIHPENNYHSIQFLNILLKYMFLLLQLYSSYTDTLYSTVVLQLQLYSTILLQLQLHNKVILQLQLYSTVFLR